MPDDCPMSATLLRRRSHGVGLSILDHLARIALTSPRVVTKLARFARIKSLTLHLCKTIPITIFAACSDFHPRSFVGEGLRIGVEMIAQRLGRSITDAIEQLFDETLIDELEKEGFL